MNIKKCDKKNCYYKFSDFKIGELCEMVSNGHICLVVSSENDKKQLVDLTDNRILRVVGNKSFIPVKAQVEVLSYGK